MNSRKHLTLLLLFVFITAAAQEKRIYLFPDFLKTVITYKAGARFSVKANYDAANQKVMYQQGGELMELINPELVDTIYFGGQKWVYHDSQFCQIGYGTAENILIAWHITKVHEGYVGVYGTSQVPSRKIELGGDFGMGTIGGVGGGMYNGSAGTNNDDGEGRNLDVWRNKNTNTYYFTKNGKPYKVSSLKSVLKAFPEQKDQIKAYVKDNGLDMTSAEKAIQIVSYLLTM